MHLKQRYLHIRNGIYQYRRWVPPKRRTFIGRREIVISLGTTDLDIALTKFCEIHKKIDAILKSSVEEPLNNTNGNSLLASDLGLSKIDITNVGSEKADTDKLEKLIADVVKNVMAMTVIGNPSKAQLAAFASTAATQISFLEVAKFYEHSTRDRWTKKNLPRERQKFYRPIYASVPKS